MEKIFAFFGYVKVPKQAIEICMCLEDDLDYFRSIFIPLVMSAVSSEKESKKNILENQLTMMIKTIQKLEEFLRKGKLLQK